MNETGFQPGDIVLSLPPYAQQVFVILVDNPNKPKNRYVAIRPDNGKTYKLGDDSLVKIGEATEEFIQNKGRIKAEGQSEDTRFLIGRQRAEYEASWRTGDEGKRWAVLANAKPGDRIKVHHVRNGNEVKFQRVIESGRKYVFSAEDDSGKVYSYPLLCICLGDNAAVEKSDDRQRQLGE